MEFKRKDIAKLVLGYLKDSGCSKAFEEFLNASKYLENHRRGIFFITRVAGLSLIEYLDEYALIYSIIQEKLEASDYYRGKQPQMELHEKLLYLLSNVSTSPIRLNNSQDENIMSSTFNRISHNSNISNKSDTVSSNSIDVSKLDKSTNTETGDDSMENDQEKCEEILTQAFLENTELIEKLADYINTEVSSKSASELDQTTIESIVQKTEEDPIVVKLLSELIRPDETSEAISDNQNPEFLQHEILVPEEICVSLNKKCKLNNLKDNKKCNQLNTSNGASKIEEQINDAVQSIVAVSLSTEPDTENKEPAIQCDAYVQPKYSDVPAQSGLLMLQSTNSVPYTTSKALPVDASKPCYIISNQSISVNPVSAPVRFGNLLSEQDILTMPTIFVCDNTQPTVPIEPPVPTILPKPTTDKTQTLSEYITLYQCNDLPTYSSIQKPIPKYKQILPVPYKEMTDCVPVTKDIQIVPPPEAVVQVKTTEPVPYSNEKTPSIKSTDKIVKNNRTTPKSGSHVRQLDFSAPEKLGLFSKNTKGTTKSHKGVENKKGTKTVKDNANVQDPPSKSDTENKIAEVPKDINATVENSAKKDNSTSNAPETKSCWDADLRALIATAAPIKAPSKQKRKLNDEEPKPMSKKLKEDAVVAEIVEPIKKDLENVENISTTKSSKTSCKPKKKTTKKIDKLKIIDETPKETETKSVNISVNEEDKIVIDIENDVSPVVDLIESPPKSEGMDKIIKHRTYKKCNTESIKKTSEEVILTTVTKIKSCEVLDDGKNALVLSPSKLNANKRSLVEVDDPNIEQPKLENAPTEKQQEVVHSLPSLETPVKKDPPTVPRTPVVSFAENVEATPFTKAVIQQIVEVGLDTIPTPKFPITPNFAFTPANNQSPLASRGTDYSTSSSYYQPSDSEQNKSIEQLLEECKRLEQPQNANNSTKERNEEEKDPITSNHLINKVEDPKEIPTFSQTFNDKKNAFNSSIIGKKNLNLVKTYLSEVEQSDSESTLSGSLNTTNSDTEWSDTNVTVVKKKVSNTYSLRPRKSTSSSVPLLTVPKNQPEESAKIEDSLTETTDTNKQSKQKVLQKMEQIRQRTLNKLKNLDTTKKPTKVTRKKPSLKKSSMKSKLNTTKLEDVQNELILKKLISKDNQSDTNYKTKNFVDDDTVVLHLSSDEEILEPFEMVETELLESSNQQLPIILKEEPQPKDVLEISAANDGNEEGLDEEAETLVKGLKQWGIHLVPNKSAKKPDSHLKTKPTETVTITPKTLDNSLEEGELQSDKEDSTRKDRDIKRPKKSIQQNQKTPKISRLKLKREVSHKHTKKTKSKCKKSDSVCNKIFDIKSFEEETFTIVYDETKKPSHNILNYDFDILSKRFTANVFIEEIGCELDRPIECTSFEMIFELESSTTQSRSSTESKLSKKPLEILYNRLIKPSNDSSEHLSPLENLYPDPPKAKRKKSTDGRNKSTEKSYKSSCRKSTKKSEINELNIENKQEAEETQGHSSKRMQSPTFDKSLQGDIDDDLMNFALLGNQTVSDSEKSSNPDLRKRKLSEEIEKNDKKPKTENCEELLKNVDVDSFLQKLHGEK